jgi:hypothetical protein
MTANTREDIARSDVVGSLLRTAYLREMRQAARDVRHRSQICMPAVKESDLPWYTRLYQGLWCSISHRQLIEAGRCLCQATRKSPSVLAVYAP